MSQTVYLPTHEMELILKVQNLEGMFQKLTLCLRGWYQVPRRKWGFCLTWLPMLLGSTTGLQWNQWRHISILGQSHILGSCINLSVWLTWRGVAVVASLFWGAHLQRDEGVRDAITVPWKFPWFLDPHFMLLAHIAI